MKIEKYLVHRCRKTLMYGSVPCKYEVKNRQPLQLKPCSSVVHAGICCQWLKLGTNVLETYMKLGL